MVSRRHLTLALCALLLVITVSAPAIPLQAQVSGPPLLGLNYGPFRIEQSPDGPYPSEAEIAEDMALIARKVDTIHIYGMRPLGRKIVELAAAQGVNIVIQAWIGPNEESNDAEIEEAIQVASAYPNVIGVLVGSEVLLREDLSSEKLIAYIQRVREAVPSSIPVGYADDLARWNQHPDVAAAVDWIGLHSYGFHSCQPVDLAASFAISQWGQMVGNPQFAGKRVILFESGWPSQGSISKCATESQGSPEAQQTFTSDMVTSARSAGLDLFLFEYGDEPWKCYTGDEPYYGCHWGLVDVDRNPKPAWGMIPDRTVSDSAPSSVTVAANGDSAPCRAIPSDSGRVTRSISTGTSVEVIGSNPSGDWKLVRDGELECWLPSSQLGGVVTPLATQDTNVVTVTATPRSQESTPVPGGLTELIDSADPALCPGGSSAAVVSVAWNSQTPDLAAACVASLLRWEGQARLQQLSHTPESCVTPPPAEEPGRTEHFRNFWALNDVGAGYFILGLRLRDAGQKDAAREAFQIILDQYSCAWIWDSMGFFWSAAQGARDQMGMMASP